MHTCFASACDCQHLAQSGLGSPDAHVSPLFRSLVLEIYGTEQFLLLISDFIPYRGVLLQFLKGHWKIAEKRS